MWFFSFFKVVIWVKDWLIFFIYTQIVNLKCWIEMRSRLKCFCADCIDQIPLNISNKFEGMFFPAMCNITLIFSSYYRINVSIMVWWWWWLWGWQSRQLGLQASSDQLNYCMHDLSDAKYIDLWSLFGALSPESQFSPSSPTTFIYAQR